MSLQELTEEFKQLLLHYYAFLKATTAVPAFPPPIGIFPRNEIYKIPPSELEELKTQLPDPILPNDFNEAKNTIISHFQTEPKEFAILAGMKVALNLNLVHICKLVMPLFPSSSAHHYLECAINSAELIRMLIEHAKLEVPNSTVVAFCNPALFDVIRVGNRDGADVLLEAGADINTTKNGRSLIEEACSISQDIQWLLQRGASRPNKPLLHLAACSGSLANVKALMELGDDMDVFIPMELPLTQSDAYGAYAKTQNTRTWPLMMACIFLNFKIASYFVEKGSLLEDPGELNTQPIHVACDLGKDKEACEFVECLINKRIKINEQRYIGIPVFNANFSFKLEVHVETPLHIAVRKSFTEMVWLLVSFGANFIFDCPYEYNNSTITDVKEMTGDKEILKALKNEWTPADHYHFPTVVRDAVLSFLLVNKRLEWNLPKDVVHLICQFIAYGWLQYDGYGNNCYKDKL